MSLNISTIKKAILTANEVATLADVSAVETIANNAQSSADTAATNASSALSQLDEGLSVTSIDTPSNSTYSAEYQASDFYASLGSISGTFSTVQFKK